MKERIKNLIDLAISYLIMIPVFWLAIQYDRVLSKISECYYIIFRIPYYKAPGKFGYYVVRTDR